MQENIKNVNCSFKKNWGGRWMGSCGLIFVAFFNLPSLKFLVVCSLYDSKLIKTPREREIIF
jgi:hypothetical protein